MRRSGAGHATGATKVAANALAFRPVVKAAGHEAARWVGARVPAARPGPVAGFLQATGVMPGEAPIQKQYTIISDGAFIHNKEGGLFLQDCKVGDILPEGGPIGRLMNLQGDIVEEIRSPYDQAYIAALRCNYYPTHAGEIAAEAIPVESREGL